MKKLFIFCSLVICMFLNSITVFAADSYDENTSTKITVSFKTGTTSYTVNEKNVKSQASALVLGKIFVPANVITDALSATLKVDLKAKTAVINYNGVEIKLTDKKKEAVIAGKKVKIDVAPYIKNSLFMVSISFLADTLGADITTENGQVTFLKEIANPNSIKDFGTLIKNTTKNKIGDSYYNWSMLLPDDLKLDTRDFNGSENDFVAKDESYYVSVYIYEMDEDSSLDNAVSSILERIKDYTLIDYGIKNSNGVEFVEFVYSDENWTYQKRVYLSDTKEYELIIYTEIEDSYLDEKYQSIIESFQFKFDNNGSTEDLSDVSKDGYRKYQDTKMKWSISMHPDWEEIKDSDIKNKVVFVGKDKSYFSLEIFSLNKDENLDSILKESVKKISEDFNSNLFTITGQNSDVIGGIKCNILYYNYKILDDITYGCEVYFIDKNYKYVLCSELAEKDYNDSKQKDMAEGVIDSFVFKELNTKTIGKLLDPDKVILSDKTRNVSNDLYTLDIPFNWKDNDINTKELQNYYLGSTFVTVTFADSNSLSDTIKGIDENMAKKLGKNYKMESKSSVTEKGTTCYKYIFIYEENDSQIREEVYVLQKDSKVMIVDFVVNNFLYGSKNSNIINNIWKSFTLK